MKKQGTTRVVTRTRATGYTYPTYYGYYGPTYYSRPNTVVFGLGGWW
jgi:hypothetical protein